MNKEQKAEVLEDLKAKFVKFPFFYVLDPTAMNAKETSALRRECFAKGIEMQIVKNKLVMAAMKSFPAEKNYAHLFETFAGQTALIFTDSAKTPALMLKGFQDKKKEKPKLKAAYIDTAVFVGEDQLDTLVQLKSKEELIGEVLGLLQSPAKNVISALLSSGQKIAGLVKTLEERAA